LVATARKLRLIYASKRKTDEIDAENLDRLARLDPKLEVSGVGTLYIEWGAPWENVYFGDSQGCS
jgi:hypothetical protein